MPTQRKPSPFPPVHLKFMQDISEHEAANAAQLAMLTEQVSKLVDQVGQLTTAVQVQSEKTEGQYALHNERITSAENRLAGLEQRERGQQNRTVQNMISGDRTWLNVIFMIVAAVIGALASGHIGFH